MNIVESVPLWHGRHLMGIFSRVVLWVLQVNLFPFYQRKLQNDFQSGCNSLQSSKQAMAECSSFSTSSTTFVSPVALHVGILIGVKRILVSFWFAFSLITKDFDHSFIFKTVIHL